MGTNTSTTSQSCRACQSIKSDLSEEGWQQRYDAGKTGWDRGESNPMLTHWLQQDDLRPCRILVPGCGRGHEVLTLAQAGFDVTAVDFAEAAVQTLRNQLAREGLTAEVVQADVFTFCRETPFDAVYEQTCLCAIDPRQWDIYQQLLACWLRPGGSMFALFMQSGQHDQPPFSCDLPSMHELFSEPDWLWKAEPIRVDHPTGMHEMACVIQRGASE